MRPSVAVRNDDFFRKMKVEKEEAGRMLRQNMSAQDLEEERERKAHENKKSVMLKTQMGGYSRNRLKGGRGAKKGGKHRADAQGERYKAVRQMLVAKSKLEEEEASASKRAVFDDELERVAAEKAEEAAAAKKKEDEEEEKRKEERWEILLRAEEATKKRDDEAAAKKKAVDAAARRKKGEDDAAARRKRGEDAAVRRRKKEKAAAAKKEATEAAKKENEEATAAEAAEIGGENWMSEGERRRKQRTSRLLGAGGRNSRQSGATSGRALKRSETKEQVVFTTQISNTLWLPAVQKVRPSAARPSLCASDGRFSLASSVGAFDEEEEESFLSSMFAGITEETQGIGSFSSVSSSSAHVESHMQSAILGPTTADAASPGSAAAAPAPAPRKTMRFSLAHSTFPMPVADELSGTGDDDFGFVATRKRSASTPSNIDDGAGVRNPRQSRRASLAAANRRLSQQQMPTGFKLDDEEDRLDRPRFDTLAVNSLETDASLAEAEAAVRSHHFCASLWVYSHFRSLLSHRLLRPPL
jgi:hypothetical protein